MYALLESHDGKPGLTPELEKLLQELTGGVRRRRIRCPLCRWQPTRASRWCCGPDCRHSWNTFDTGGRCPACSKQWKVTQCLACHRYSPHEAWYEKEPGLPRA
jgi:hypothetical protein